MAHFSPFSRLPLELQDLIWETSIPRPSAVAYKARLSLQPRHRNEDGSMGSNSKNKVHLDHVKPANRGSDFRSMLSALLVTCRRSSAVAILVYNSIQPAPEIRLRGLGHPVNVSTDLVIVQDGWQDVSRAFNALSARHLEPRKTLRYVALELNADLSRGLGFNSILGFLNICEDLHAFYFVLDPDYLPALQGPWLPEEDRDWIALSRYDEPFLVRFFDAYKQAQGIQMPLFRTGNREYYELGLDYVAQAGGLEEVAEYLFLAHQYFNSSFGEDADEEDLMHRKCMFLSWRLC
ncbi:hypothetical protein OCS_01804 [Ophiocordyceps sinensis CO18]|nr:hypothetical protein OCS_01804 [Ophiocordyceps sinensis CO18]